MRRRQTTTSETEKALDGANDERPLYEPKSRVDMHPKRKDRINMTFFMSVATHGRLKALALERNTSLQQLVAQALDKWLAEQAEPPFEPGSNREIGSLS